MEQAHAYLWLRLSNTGDPTADAIGRLLRDLRGRRNNADYDLGRPRSRANATDATADARDLIARMDGLVGTPAEARIRDGMRAYEQNVLKVDTWGPSELYRTSRLIRVQNELPQPGACMARRPA